ncbi:MAG: hemerythrin domain-containing protein [Acidobacteria bacterium]|nr:hemerythrin domain-containing protein [Acidobacteriota bacterium]
MFLKVGQRADHGFDEPLGLLSDCHRRIEHFLQVLLSIAQDAAGGPLGDEQRWQLEAALAYFATAGLRHTADEEESVFPRLKASSEPAAAQVQQVLARLERDHSDAVQHHQAVDVLVRQWLGDGRLDPADASQLATRLASLEALYRSHIAVEDNELFPVATRLLSARQLQEIGREMAARRGLDGSDRRS